MSVFRPLLLTTVATLIAAEPGAVKGLKREPGGHAFTLDTAGGMAMKLTFHRDDVVRVQVAPGGRFADPQNDATKAQILVDTSVKGAPVKVTEGKAQITFATPRVTLQVDRRDARLALKDASGRVLWEEAKPLQIDEKATVQTLASDPSESFFGGGQQNGYFTHKGTKIDIVADGEWNEGGHPNPAPYYASSKGYGVLRHTFAVGTYDFRDPKVASLSHEEQRFDAFYFVGGDLHKVVDLYTQFTGRPNFVPIWALEMGEADAWMGRDKKTKELLKDEKGEYVRITPHVVPKLAEQYRKNDFPGGWILPNDGYGCGYVDLPEVVQRLKGLGFYTGLWTEKALDKTTWEVGTAGTRVQKLDVAWTGPAYQFSLDANKTAWTSLVQNSESRGFVWTVQGWAGTQRYAVCWTGDQYGSWDLIRYHIPTLIGSGLSGQAYATTDVDGIFGGSPETYTRDLQWKCFTPVLYAMNGWSDINKSPWSYPEPYKSINRQYLKLKMRLTPYMYHYAREAWDTGAPIVRGLLWHYPEDPKTLDRSTQYQYLLGEWMLVAPVFTSMNVNKGWRKEPIYLPKGAWFDYADGRMVQGPTTLGAYPITLDKLPIFIRGGAIVPMYPEMLYNDQKPKDPLTFDCYPWGTSHFDLYEDDGLTRQFQKGAFATQRIQMEAPEGVSGPVQLTIQPSVGSFEGKLATRVYQFQVHTPFKPKAILMDGKPVLELKEAGAFKDCVSAWYYDPADKRGTVHLRLPRTRTDRAVKVTLDIAPGQAFPGSEPYPVPQPTPELDKTLFKVTASSNHDGAEIQNAFDGTPETYWHAKYRGEGVALPITVDIQLGNLTAVNGFRYLPRQKSENGRIAGYELYVGRSTENLKQVAAGTFPNTADLQTVTFPTTWGEVVRLKVLSEVHGKAFASAAEFDVTQDLGAAPLADEVAYLSDLKPATAKGSYAADKSLGGRGLVVNGQSYAKGLGVGSGSELVYQLDGTWDRLSGHVGVDSEVGEAGSLVFRVVADGKVIFESPVMSGKNVKQLMELNIKGVKELRLTVTGQGKDAAGDHADWIDARLVRKGSGRS